MQVSSGRDSVHVFFKYLNTLARVKSASVGDASLYDKHFVANIRSGLTPAMYCRLVMQIQAFLFRQRRHHCLRVLQLNNVHAFLHIFGSRFHCESSAIAIVYTSVLESQVSYKCARVQSFSSLDHDQLRDLRPEFFKCRWLGTDERVVHMRYHTCFVRLMHKQTSLQFATFETHVLCEYSSEEFCEVSACCSHAIHRPMQSPDPSITFLSFRRSSEHFTR